LLRVRAVFGLYVPDCRQPDRRRSDPRACLCHIAPTDQIPIIRLDPRDGERELTMARWGLVPGWMKQIPKVPHINAGRNHA
jgi:putative SOS response-associated peptidase YedK